MIEKYKNIIKKMMSEKRYLHSVSVSNVAAKLAKRYNYNEGKAAIAGILHDITKEMPDEFHLELFKRHNVKLDEIEKISKKLWHSISGSLYIKENLNINDEEILNAVKYHTTGRKGMTLIDKIIFLSDFLAEDRQYENSKEMEELAFENLDAAVIYGLKLQMEGFFIKNLLLSKNMFEAYNDMIINHCED